VSSDAESRYNLGIALATARRFNEAIEQFSMALRIRPGYQAAEEALAALRKGPQ
jgi:tetratricopeptide (TPR) repeat protein